LAEKNMVDRYTRKPDEQIEKMAREAIEEARMVLPGIQALFGFQLIAVFNDRFKQLTDGEQVTHLTAVLLVALSIALIMAPAAYHRQVEPGTVSEFFVKMASWLITAAMVPLMVGLSLEAYLLSRLILDNVVASSVIAGVLLAVFAGLWFAFPHVAANRNRWAQGHHTEAQRPLTDHGRGSR
jgi:hypothetical protein